MGRVGTRETHHCQPQLAGRPRASPGPAPCPGTTGRSVQVGKTPSRRGRCTPASMEGPTEGRGRARSHPAPWPCRGPRGRPCGDNPQRQGPGCRVCDSAVFLEGEPSQSIKFKGGGQVKGWGHDPREPLIVSFQGSSPLPRRDLVLPPRPPRPLDPWGQEAREGAAPSHHPVHRGTRSWKGCPPGLAGARLVRGGAHHPPQ